LRGAVYGGYYHVARFTFLAPASPTRLSMFQISPRQHPGALFFGLMAMTREREKINKAIREKRFEETDKTAKELIEAAAVARREKSERLLKARLAAQQGAPPTS
jgi:hypothetical protein